VRRGKTWRMPSPAPPSSAGSRRYLAEDIAQRLGHSADYWLRKARRKEVPHRRVGRSIWWEDEDVQQIIAAALVAPVDPLASAVPRRRRAHP
jgi:hypothetical protein